MFECVYGLCCRQQQLRLPVTCRLPLPALLLHHSRLSSPQVIFMPLRKHSAQDAGFPALLQMDKFTARVGSKIQASLIRKHRHSYVLCARAPNLPVSNLSIAARDTTFQDLQTSCKMRMLMTKGRSSGQQPASGHICAQAITTGRQPSSPACMG